MNNRLPITTVAFLALCGCGYSWSPKLIEVTTAKGEPETYFACTSYVEETTEGENYEVTFIDQSGSSHDIHGAKTVAVSDIPADVKVCRGQ